MVATLTNKTEDKNKVVRKKYNIKCVLYIHCLFFDSKIIQIPKTNFSNLEGTGLWSVTSM